MSKYDNDPKLRIAHVLLGAFYALALAYVIAGGLGCCDDDIEPEKPPTCESLGCDSRAILCKSRDLCICEQMECVPDPVSPTQ